MHIDPISYLSGTYNISISQKIEERIQEMDMKEAIFTRVMLFLWYIVLLWVTIFVCVASFNLAMMIW